MVAECRKMVVNTEHMHAHIDRHMDMHACIHPFIHAYEYICTSAVCIHNHRNEQVCIDGFVKDGGNARCMDFLKTFSTIATDINQNGSARPSRAKMPGQSTACRAKPRRRHLNSDRKLGVAITWHKQHTPRHVGPNLDDDT